MFFALIKHKKHMHCQRRLVVGGKKTTALALLPHSEFPCRQKDNCVEYCLLLKKITVSKQIYQLCPHRSKRTHLQSCPCKLTHILTQTLEWIFACSIFHCLGPRCIKCTRTVLLLFPQNSQSLPVKKYLHFVLIS